MTDPKSSEFLWRSPEPWSDLTDTVHDIGAFTAITRSGAARLVDVAGRVHRRVPFEGGAILPGDGDWMLYSDFAATPCGVSLYGDGGGFSTPLWAVLVGLAPEWTTRADCRPIVDAIVSDRRPEAPDHRPEPCAALYCPHRAQRHVTWLLRSPL